MSELRFEKKDRALTVFLAGHISSLNAPEIEQDLFRILRENPAQQLILDCEELDYIASAGLRVLLRLKKSVPSVSLVNVSPEVYSVFEMTGFTEMMDIRKAYRVLSAEGCPVIGHGANGEIRRIDPETVVKVYRDRGALPEITRERELARTAFVLGIPTAIPYDVVRLTEGGFGSVFELLNAESFADVLIRGEKTVEEAARMSADLLKLIHSTLPKEGAVPSARAAVLSRAEALDGRLPQALYEKLMRLLTELPDDPHMLHGDFHLKNILYQNGEALLIDMDSLCHGVPVFELAAMYSAYRGFPDLDHSISRAFLGIDYETGAAFWERSLACYLDTEDEALIRATEEKAAVVSYARIMSRAVRKGGDTATARAEIDNCRAKLAALLPKVDTLQL